MYYERVHNIQFMHTKSPNRPNSSVVRGLVEYLRGGRAVTGGEASGKPVTLDTGYSYVH